MSGIRSILVAIFAFVLLASAGVCFRFGRDGVETDLMSLVGKKDSLVAALSSHNASQIRVLCADERCAEMCREAFPFDVPASSERIMELVRTHGKGLLSAKKRAQLAAGETNKVARSAMRRDYSGVGLFPKADDPYYFLNDFVMDFRAFAPSIPEGAILLFGDASKFPGGIPRLIALAGDEGGISLSGAPFHTYLAMESSKDEINILGAVSLMAVLLIGFALFRSFRFVLPTFLSLGCGFLVGSAAVLLMPGRPHVLTFLFGTTLVGLGVDYCYHGLAHAERDTGFIRNLTGALVTTCLAFSPLFFSRVAVLNQMAVFTVAGLVAIYSAVLIRGGRLALGADGPSAFWLTGGGSLASVAKIAFAVVVIAGCMKVTLGNDPSSFHKMDARLAKGEAAVAEIVGSGDARLALIDMEKWQRENAALKAKMGFEPAGDFLSADNLPPQMTLRFHGRDYLVVPAAMAEGMPEEDVSMLDVKGELRAMFDSFAAETMRLVALSFVVMTLALVVIFRKRFFAFVVPVACALVATVGVLGWIGAPVNFFQLLSFFILVGLGIDYSIFHKGEMWDGSSRRAHVVFASFLTSFVGLGMLFFTGFPVTRSMGETLGIGIFFSYLFSLPAMRKVERSTLVCEEMKLTSHNWDAQPQRGSGKIRMWLIFAVYRLLGKSFTKFVSFFIILCVYPWAGPVKDALRKFFAMRRLRVGCAGPQIAFPFRVMLNFAWSMVDKMDACCLKKSVPTMTVRGDEGWMKGGCFLLSTHVGCIEVLPALRQRSPGGVPSPRVHAFQQMGRDAIYTSYFVRHLDKDQLTLHAVEDIGVETAVEMQDAIRRGEIVLMAGDRLSLGANRGAALKHEFLGCACEFPKGVFRFAKLMECPIYAISCVRVGWNAYEVEARRLGEDVLGDYVAFLESAALRFPEQWYQFYDFFS